ncbi:hypothetical protein Tco_1043128 [Tanacetum coccineum]|uniref:Uncharacterized protein n=1 Tax=Tanacetum coccineum TaxID=301880 RepID=A0ABQ5GNQ9_9ASTR
MYHDLYLGGKALAKRENVGFDLTKSDLFLSFVKDLTTKGVGHHVADSHTGNHREDDFMPLETIQRYPINIRIFPDLILFLAGLKTSWEHETAFRNFMFAEDDKDLSFLSKEPSPSFSIGSPSISINTELPLQKLKDRKCRIRGRSSKPHVKRMLVQGLPDGLELQNANACHLKISNITPPVWRRGYEVLKEKEEGKKECEDLKAKFKAAMADFDNNLAVNVLREKIVALSGEVKEHKASLKRMLLESKKWAIYQVSLLTLEPKVASLEAEKERSEASELSHAKRLRMSNAIGRRCVAFKEVAKIKEPFDLSRMKGYRSLYKKEHTKDGNDLATATFPLLSKVVADPSTPIEALLSKKSQSLQRTAPTRTPIPSPLTPSLQVTPATALVSKPQSPPPVT